MRHAAPPRLRFTPPGLAGHVCSGDDRDRRAKRRDDIANAQDRRSHRWDEEAEARDRRAEVRDESASVIDLDAVKDREAASRDRRAAAEDRLEAAHDRRDAAGDRNEAAKERAISSIDELTGAYRRDSGSVELEREMTRAKRTGSSLVLAFVDVDGLKRANDSRGHAAGDALLRRTVDSMRSHLRPYDPIVRYGGDEFVCALLDLELSAAEARFGAISLDLHASGVGSVTTGFAELRTNDSLSDLLARADDALMQGKRDKVSLLFRS